jgi:LysM repeat protein
MSNKKKVNRKRRRGPWYKMFAKTETRLSARVTREEDWQTDVPNIRLSRAFVIVLLMHLVVGGALIAFTLMNPGDANAQAKATPKRPAAKVAGVDKQTEGVPGKTETRPSAKVASNDRADDMRRHIVHSGDSVSKIARQYGVSSDEIHAVNRIDELYQLYQGRVLKIPVSASNPVPLESAFASRPSNNGTNVVKTEAPRFPITIPRAEVTPPVVIEAPTPPAAAVEETILPESIATISRPVVEEEVVVTPPRPVREPTIVRPRGVPVAAPAPTERRSAGKTYKVVKGDNPFRIAKKYGVNYKKLLSHNGITDPSKLQIGQTLRIPE